MSSVTIAIYVASAAGVLLVVPTVLFCFRPEVLTARFVSGPDEVGTGASPAATAVLSELGRMGFRALGVKVEKTPLRPMVRELSFVAAWVLLRWR